MKIWQYFFPPKITWPPYRTPIVNQHYECCGCGMGETQQDAIDNAMESAKQQDENAWYDANLNRVCFTYADPE